MPAAPIRITEPDDPRVDVFRDVRDRDLRGRERVFMAESELVLRRLLRTPDRVAAVFLSDHKHEVLGDALDVLPESVPVYVAPISLISRIAGFHVHRGALAVGHRPLPSALSIESRFAGTLAAPAALIAAEGITNVDNMGALFRNAAAFGAAGIVLDPACCDPLYRKSIRVSMGHALSVPYAVGTPWPDALVRLRERHGVQLIAAEASAEATPVWALPALPRVLFVFGSEGAGVAPETLRLCDEVCQVPMAAGVPSLNVAVASAVFLYEWRRQLASGRQIDA